MQTEKTQRQLKINKRIRNVLAEAFLKSSFEVGGKKIFVGVTKADISPDLRNVSIYLDIVDVSENDKKLIVSELNKSESISYIKKIIAQALNLRIAPIPFFKVDLSQEASLKVQKILDEEAKKIGKNE